MTKLNWYRRLLNRCLNESGNPSGAYDKRKQQDYLLVHWALPVSLQEDTAKVSKTGHLACYYEHKRRAQLRQVALHEHLAAPYALRYRWREETRDMLCWAFYDYAMFTVNKRGGA